jgi:hypothetical protein
MGKAAVAGFRGAKDPACGPTGVVATAYLHKEINITRETPGGGRNAQPDAREGQAGLPGESDRFVVLSKRGNARGGKGPDFGNVPAVRTAGDWRKPVTLLRWLGSTLRHSRCRRRATVGRSVVNPSESRMREIRTSGSMRGRRGNGARCS